MEQLAQRDAPDPRDSRPPCYSDAILMPRLDGSFASLDELGGGHIKHKRRRKTEVSDEEVEEEVPLRRNRCRSEEIISMREIVTRTVRSPRLAPRTHPTEIEPIDHNVDDEVEGVHYMSTDILTLDHSPGPSSRARSPQPAIVEPPQPTTVDVKSGSVEKIRNFNRSINSLDRSPYATRKLGHMESFKGGRSKARSTPPPVPPKPKENVIEIHEDHFKATPKERRDSTDSGDSSDFVTITTDKHRDSFSSSSGSVVVVKKPSSPTSF